MGEPKVLVVEDENDIRRHIVRALEREGMTVEQAEDGEQGWTVFERGLHPIVVLDLRMPKRDGLSLLQLIHERRPETQIIIMTGHGTKTDAIRALNLHASAYLEKPPDLDALLAAVRAGWEEFQDRIGVPLALGPDEAGPPPDLEEVRRALGKPAPGQSS